ncbi:MAG TPA: hypothetical protein VNJ01_13385 [Bacteriovoracaceae bacterium]|nr:hypothetical protein [Bacteriovoracaceae bacterium]
MKKVFLVFLLCLASNAFSSEIVCVDRNIQDSQITARFKINNTNGDVFVFLDIPSGETETRTAWGGCVAEEDSRELSLRCDNVQLSRLNSYFVRLDGNKATVAKNGKVIAQIPCKTKR